MVMNGHKDEIVNILRSPDEAKRRARYGGEYVLANFGWDNIAETWEDVYRKCAGK